jgi:hypothetical protein
MHNVKRFGGRGVAIERIGDGVNVLCAANEFGKSTSFEALHGLFFQPHTSTAGDVRNLRPYSGGSPLVEVDVDVGNARYRITKRFYGNRLAKVVDLISGRLVAQADEAENLISGLIQGGAGGPAGLLWLWQGLTGIEQRSRTVEESDRLARTSLLESVQGEVEAVTGGRRMAEIMAVVNEEAAALTTGTGRPKAGGRYHAAIEARDRLVEKERRLATEVEALRDELDRRSGAHRRLAELENADDRSLRRDAIAVAEAALDEARAQAERLRTAEAELRLAGERKATAESEHLRFSNALAEASLLAEASREAASRRDEAARRRHAVIEAITQAHSDADAAEVEEAGLRNLLEQLAAADRSREAAERRTELEDVLRRAETLRGDTETREAEWVQLRLPATAVDELAEVDALIAQIRAAQNAARPSITVDYEAGQVDRITLNGAELPDGQEHAFDGQAVLVAPGIARITLRSRRPDEDEGSLAASEERRRTLLDSMGLPDLLAARAQQARAKEVESQVKEARAQLAVLAPDGVTKLREAVAAFAVAPPVEDGPTGDPDELRADCAAAEERKQDARRRLRAMEAERGHADTAFVAAETELAGLQAREEQVAVVLGAADGREARLQALAVRLGDLEGLLAAAQEQVDALGSAGQDLEAAEATLRRHRSVEQAAETEVQQLRESIAGLNARITARSDDAIEEEWRQAHERLVSAEVRVAAFEREVAVLARLTLALDGARSNARDLYLTPVMGELRPLLRLLFDDVSITFDDRTLLPQTIVRGGQEEEVDRLSGGMREQLSILTRLAFARLLARDGRPAPVILDDALVYSDDDRIERMFDALHRQASDQQIIVFSCRQRAFQRLGGNVLQMIDWEPVT